MNVTLERPKDHEITETVNSAETAMFKEMSDLDIILKQMKEKIKEEGYQPPSVDNMKLVYIRLSNDQTQSYCVGSYL